VHKRKKEGFYEKYIKRVFDMVCSLLAILCFGWLYIIVALFVKVKLGSPVLFTQLRPGIINSKSGNEKIFRMYKFRSMTDERDEAGTLLPDERRLTSFGKVLRNSSLDELPEIFNILKGDMSIVGPRPQLVKDMVFMTEEQRKRHCVRPGLTGLAQVNGRNDISWEDKLNWDLKYIEKITFVGDIRIIFQTIIKAFVKQEGITKGGMATSEDLGDYLLNKRKISKQEYDKKQDEARKLLKIWRRNGAI
jgi:undecaprenyl phosphate N,N'-diacetylbacillosamine 1-phosphate transferase